MLRVSPTSLRLGLVLLALAACDRATTEPDGARPANAPTLAVANTWLVKAEMPRLRAGFAAAGVPNASGQWIVYAIGGGSTIVQAYNASTNSWSLKAPYPQQLNLVNGAGVIGGKIYVSGGVGLRRIATGALYRYDPASNTWAGISDMPAPGFRGVTGVINNQLYILTNCLGGADCEPFVPLAFYRYNPATDQWTTLANPPSAHRDGMGGVIGGKFYVVGGQDGLNQLDVYNPATNSWTTKASMPKGQFATSGRWDGAGLALSGKLYVIGGWQFDQNGQQIQTRTNSVYNPSTNVWTNRAILPSAQAFVRAARVVVGGQSRIEVIGGDRPGTNVQYVP
jgi:N-acetylneuraminic acid mutarotase